MSEYNQSHKQVKVIQQRKRTTMKTTMEHRYHSASILTAVLPLNVQLVKIAEPVLTYTAPPCQKTNSNKCSERSTMSGHNSKHVLPKAMANSTTTPPQCSTSINRPSQQQVHQITYILYEHWSSNAATTITTTTTTTTKKYSKKESMWGSDSKHLSPQ